MQSRAEGLFSQKQTTWKERIKKCQSGKEQKTKDWFIHSQVDLPVKPWYSYCESTCRSFAVLGSVLIRDRRVITIAVTTAIHSFRSTPKGSHRFHWSNDTAWSTMAVTLSVVRVGTCHIQHCNIQHSNIAIFQHRQLN